MSKKYPIPNTIGELLAGRDFKECIKALTSQLDVIRGMVVVAVLKNGDIQVKYVGLTSESEIIGTLELGKQLLVNDLLDEQEPRA